MASKKLLTICALLLLALAACDDKADGDGAPADAAGINDAETAEQSQKKAPAKKAEDPAEDTAPKRTTASSPNNATVNEEPPLDISKLLTVEDFSQMTRAKLVEDPLVGKAPSPDYNAIHVHQAGRNFYGAGLQVWKIDAPKAAVKRVEQMSQQYLGVEDPSGKPVADATAQFLSNRAGILTHVFALDGYVVAVSCGEKFCKDGEKDLFEISKKVAGRFGERKE